ncbi:MAG: ADP-ribosylation factor [Lentinula lateritia]|nr:MAG: ADP-ribosylation factor [Lentinula lateritia]
MLNQLLDRFYPTKYRRRIGLSGLDYCGKTTLINKLKYGKVIETIPTIGLIFTTANLNIPTSEGILRCTIWETGAPGCSPQSYRNLIKSVLTPSAAIIWLVDGRDRDRLEESAEELESVMEPGGSHTLSVTAPILILATKQDLPNIVPLEDIRRKFNRAISGRKAVIFGISLVQEGSDGLLSAFDWLQAALKNAPSSEPSTVPSNSSNLASDPEGSFEKKLSSWISRAETDSSPEEFLSQFHAINLPSWDHFTHIRLAYVILTTFGRQKGKDMIFDGIEKYIRESPQTRGRTFHVTMTYFWIQLVHFGICNMPSSTPATSATKEESHKVTYSSDVDVSTVAESYRSFSSTSSFTPLPSPQTEFAGFLLLNPFVAQPNLWEEYYSKDVIMSPEAKKGMVLPDKKSLPSLVYHTVKRYADN